MFNHVKYMKIQEDPKTSQIFLYNRDHVFLELMPHSICILMILNQLCGTLQTWHPHQEIRGVIWANVRKCMQFF